MTGGLVKDGNPFMTLALTGTDPRVLSLAGLEVQAGAIVSIGGDAPVIISVHGTVRITGRIGASASGVSSGPGGDTCAGQKGDDTGPPPVPAFGAGGGGGGGAFGSAGAAGGTGDCDSSPNTAGGGAMNPVGEELLVPLRGGCRGGAGGEEDPEAVTAGTPGMGGGGGGAFQITVRDMLILDATARVSASGGGGQRGVNAQYSGGPHVGVGGGGGGSGGGILLESGMVVFHAQATLCANGGGGGAGTHNNDPVTDAVDGVCGAIAADGGTGPTDGGDAAFLTTAAAIGGAGTRTDDGGGGGGGGVGRIRVRSIGSTPTTFLSTPPAHVD